MDSLSLIHQSLCPPPPATKNTWEVNGVGGGWEGAKHVSRDTIQKCGGHQLPGAIYLSISTTGKQSLSIWWWWWWWWWWWVGGGGGGGGGGRGPPVCMNPCVRAYPYGSGGKRSSLYESLCQSLWWWWWWWWGGGGEGRSYLYESLCQSLSIRWWGEEVLPISPTGKQSLYSWWWGSGPPCMNP